MKTWAEENRLDIVIFDSTGSTTEIYGPYYDMSGYDRADFVITAKLPNINSNTTKLRLITARLLQAPTATQPATLLPITSATAVFGKGTTGAISTPSLRLSFTTLASGATWSINGSEYGANATGSATSTSGMIDSTGATANATVASEAFIALFNNTGITGMSSARKNNAENFIASSEAAGAVVHIRPKVLGSTFVTATGSSLVAAGADWITGHIGIETGALTTNNRYISIGINSSATTTPMTVTLIRSKSRTEPVNSTKGGHSYSKTLGSSSV